MVKADESLLGAFIGQLSTYDLARMAVCAKNGWGMDQKGEAGRIFVMEKYGTPEFVFADGNNGVNLNEKNIGFPCSVTVCATFNEELAYETGTAIADEAKEKEVNVILAPAANLHRNPLGGRNAEYFSEDPFLAGKMAGALVKGVQSQGIGATVKHFACNNKETNRKNSDSRVSERAIREIYLKAFEIIVKKADPWAIMSSYNLVNGVHTANSHDLLTAAARDEWGFAGYVMTDWGTSEDMSGLFAYKYNLKYGHSTSRECVLAGNDLQMPGQQGNRQEIIASVADGTLPLGQLQTCAYRILNVVLQSLAYDDCKPYGDQFDLEEAVTVTKA